MKLLKLLTLSSLTAAVSLTAVADWILIDDFESSTGEEDYNLLKKFDSQGDVFISKFDPQDPDNFVYFADPGPSRDVGGNNQIWNSVTLPQPVPEGGKATLKYRMYFFESGPFNVNIGLSDVAVEIDESRTKAQGQLVMPNDYNAFESQVGWTDKGIITVRNGNGFSDTIVPIPVGEWTTIYYLIDNATDRTMLYYQGESMDEPAVVELTDGSTDFIFRNGTTDPLVTLTYVSAGSNSGPVSVFLLDDIYYDPTGFNLDGADLPDGPIGPVMWGGTLLDDNGNVDTGDWMGLVHASTEPWVYSYSIDSFVYIPSSHVTDEGAWTYFPYQDSPPSTWSPAPNGAVDTGSFMNYVYDSGTGWVYSYKFSRWIHLPTEGTDANGAWGFLPVKRIPSQAGDYLIPAITQTPLIDGILSEGEWAQANKYDHSYDNLINSGIGTSWIDTSASGPQPDAPRPSADVYVAATKQGLYMAFDVTDDQLTITQTFGSAGNRSDGVQIGVDVNPDPQDRTSTVLFDINPASLEGGQPTGPVNVFARWAAVGNVAGNPGGYDVSWGVHAASSIHEGGYSMEVMIPWAYVTSFGVDSPLEVGTPIRLTVALLDEDAGTDGNTQEILWDAGAGVRGIGNAANWPFGYIAEPLAKAPITHSVPRVANAPLVNGTFDPGEWDMGYYTEATFDNWVARSAGNSRQVAADAVRSEGGIYLVATDEALYMAAQIVAPTLSITTPFGAASNNESGVQMALSLEANPAVRDNASVLWDFTAATLDGGALTGPANVFGRWGITGGYDAAWGIETAGSITDDGYIIEVKMPWDTMRNAVNVPVTNALQKGDVFRLSFIVVNVLEDGTVNELLVDFGNGEMTIGNATTWNTAVIRN